MYGSTDQQATCVKNPRQKEKFTSTVAPLALGTEQRTQPPLVRISMRNGTARVIKPYVPEDE